tara:strand:+ start:100 stop:354 length:255 start_codon:yes stop_codon:yes gene_type:complete
MSLEELDEPEKALAESLIAADSEEGDEVDVGPDSGLTQDEKEEVMTAAAEKGLSDRAVAVTKAIQTYIEAKLTEHDSGGDSGST